jgi:DNA-binding transcriptional ArsR family regulator
MTTLAPMTTATRQQQRQLQCIGNHFRLRVLGALHEQDEKCPFNVKHLCKLLDVDQPMLSHHLAAMLEAGLIECHKEASYSYYFACDDVLRKVFTEAQCLAGLPASP